MKHHTIGDHMSDVAATVSPTSTLAEAREKMTALGIRHLPVVDGAAQVVGMLSQGDLYVMEAIVAADAEDTPVSSAMSREVYCVAPSTPLAQVAAEMGRRHIGSAIVVEGGQPIGIFTATDACRVLGELIDR